MKMKTLGRYVTGWSDIFGKDAYEQDSFKVNAQKKTGLEDVPTETLKNLWLARFGDRAVTVQVAHELRLDDIMNVAQELLDRNQVSYERVTRPDTLTSTAYFVLEKEDGNH